MYFMPPLKEFPLEFCNSSSAKKSTVMPLTIGGESLMIRALILI